MNLPISSIFPWSVAKRSPGDFEGNRRVPHVVARTRSWQACSFASDPLDDHDRKKQEEERRKQEERKKEEERKKKPDGKDDES